MHPPSHAPSRTLGLLGATGVGVGAIVGGGILALAGVAFATTGPGAILAFALNGVIAGLTALSFAELAARFPRSGGTYAYARRVLTIETAFGVGWVVWFASVVAAVLYALGFAVFLVPFLEQVVRAAGVAEPPAALGGRFALLTYALGAVAYYCWALSRSPSGGGQRATVGKLVVFAILILGGFWVLLRRPPTLEELTDGFTPFLSRGGPGLVQAMGYTFIALQGFDLIAAVGGEVREPHRNIPRAMFLSLGAALVIYLPLLFLIVAVGTPGRSVADAAAADPEILVAVAARSFLGPTGYWLVIVGGVLSMLSALQANLLAASRVARTMAADRTLPARFARISPRHGAPGAAVVLTGVAVAFVLVAVPDVAAAGAVSSLIFLASFALAHAIAYLARARSIEPAPFRSAYFPLVPVLGGASCVALALYQALAVPASGVLAALWLSVGAVLYRTHLAPRARVVDAASEAQDPDIIQLRGRTPLVLVPVANPAHAGKLVTMAQALAPPAVARVQLLSVVRPNAAAGTDLAAPELRDAQAVLGGALSAAISGELSLEALITLSHEPWNEIERVANRSACETVLLGFGRLDDAMLGGPLERLAGRMAADLVVLRAPVDWEPSDARRILVPSGGGRAQSPLRARLLGNLARAGEREVDFLRVVPWDAAPSDVERMTVLLRRLALDEAAADARALVVRGDDVVTEVVGRAKEHDLVVLGLRRVDRRARAFGRVVRQVAAATSCPLLMISQRD